jgi:hypothetical protein
MAETGLLFRRSEKTSESQGGTLAAKILCGPIQDEKPPNWRAFREI